MYNKGWISVYRQLTDKGFYKKSSYVHLWIHLLLKANHKPKEFPVDGIDTKINAGQLLTGRKKLSEDTGIPETTIERILKRFENEHQIGQQKTNKYRVITILNWNNYQSSDRTTDNNRTATGQQMDTNNNAKNEKNENKINRKPFFKNLNYIMYERRNTIQEIKPPRKY
ncbi:MAG: hypothetical protein LWX07_07930 [Bacteroidetes bacterium]|nr:hypothetical protein [Bacteroidota bacterium]